MAKKACIFNIQKFSLHDGPGIRSVVFFKGCPLRCFWCANPESQSLLPETMWDNTTKQMELVGTYRTVPDVIEELMQDKPFYDESHGGVTLSGGEVLTQAEFAIELLSELHSLGIHTACETTGYADGKIFSDFCQHIDLMYFDIKHYDTIKHKKGVGVKNEIILNNLKQALDEKIELIVRIPIIPDFNDSLEDAENFALLLKRLNISYVELLPFHQFGENKYTYLNRDYALKDIPQLKTDDLLAHQEIFNNHKIKCHIN